jgi:hypothetical protein
VWSDPADRTEPEGGHVKRQFLVVAATLVFVGMTAGPAYAVSTQLTVALNKRAVTYDSPSLLSGQLKTASGSPLAGKTVYLTREGVRAKALTTDSHGRVSVRVNYGGRAVWRLRFAGTSRYEATESPAVSTYAVYMLSRTYRGEYDGDTYTTTRIFRLTRGHRYQVMTDHAAWVFLGTGDTDLMADWTGRMRSFAFGPTQTSSYWCEWDWGGSVSRGDSTIRVIIW